MKVKSLSGSPRENVGSKGAKALRQEGRVPGVIYGNGENIHFHVKETDFNKLINTPEVYFINIEIDGKEYKSIIKDMQFHPVTDRCVHIDLLAVADDKQVQIDLPLILEGSSPGVLNGGKLRKNYRKIKVKALPAALPENITVDISTLKIGDFVRLGDIDIKGLTIIGDLRDVCVSVKTSRVAVVEEEEEVTEGEEGAEGEEGEKKEGEDSKE